MLTGEEAPEHLGLGLSLCYPWAGYVESSEMPPQDQGCNWYQDASLGISNLSCVQVPLCLMAVLECFSSLEPCRWLQVLAPLGSGDMPWASVHSGVCSMRCVSPRSPCWCFLLLEQLQLGLTSVWEKGLTWGCLRPEPLGSCGMGCSRGFAMLQPCALPDGTGLPLEMEGPPRWNSYNGTGEGLGALPPPPWSHPGLLHLAQW